MIFTNKYIQLLIASVVSFTIGCGFMYQRMDASYKLQAEKIKSQALLEERKHILMVQDQVDRIIESKNLELMKSQQENAILKDRIKRNAKHIDSTNRITNGFVRSVSKQTDLYSNAGSRQFNAEEITLYESTPISEPHRVATYIVDLHQDDTECVLQLNALIDVVKANNRK